MQAGRELVERYGFNTLVVTLDGDGMALVSADGTAEHVPTRPRQVCDITGADDVALSMLGLCYAAGMGLREAIAWANVAAGLEVERVGVMPVSPEEIIEATGPADKAGWAVGSAPRTGASAKLVTLEQIAALAAGYRRDGKTVVFTNGCFDLLHVGHVT